MVPHAHVKGFDTCSHFVPMEEPGATAEAIFDFLKTRALI
jgi:pimeloyl-ACP methyl ester carboxylesterase